MPIELVSFLSIKIPYTSMQWLYTCSAYTPNSEKRMLGADISTTAGTATMHGPGRMLNIPVRDVPGTIVHTCIL